MRNIFLVGFCCTLYFLVSCRPARIDLGSPHSPLERLEGYASFRITGEQGPARSKFSFFFQLPHQGWIQVSSFLGKAIYWILIDQGEAYFIVPSKKVYWQGEEEEIVHKFLGFRLSLEEIEGLLSGRWKGKDGGETTDVENWAFEKDENGRIRSGRRHELSFEVKEFFNSSHFARRIVFYQPLREAHVKVLSIGVNPPPRKERFSKSFLRQYEQKTWFEIEEMIEDAR